MSITFPVLLGKTEIITERPFTHTDHITKDREILLHVAKQLCLVLEKLSGSLEVIGPIFIDEQNGCSHRYFVSNPKLLTQKNTIHLVGFFSHKQNGAEATHFGDLDERLIEQIPIHEGILSYNTMALPNGDFGNMVLIVNEEIKSKWLHSKIHNQAVALSPGYYQHVRINNGILPNGVMDSKLLQITRVKYYDYAEDPPWKAIRELHHG